MTAAVSHSAGKLRWAVNGVLQAQATQTAPFSNPLDRISIGYGQYTSGALNGAVEDFQLIPQALSDAQLQEISQ